MNNCSSSIGLWSSTLKSYKYPILYQTHNVAIHLQPFIVSPGPLFYSLGSNPPQLSLLLMRPNGP